MRYAKKQREYNLILTLAAFISIIIAIVIAVGLNKKQQVFYSEAQNFAKHVALYLPVSSVNVGRTVQVMIYAEQPSEKDWLGIYPLQEQTPIAKRRLTDCALSLEGTAHVGYCNLIAPVTPGMYVIRLYRDYLFMTAFVS